MKAMVDEDKLGVRLWIMVRAGLKQRGARSSRSTGWSTTATVI